MDAAQFAVNGHGLTSYSISRQAMKFDSLMHSFQLHLLKSVCGCLVPSLPPPLPAPSPPTPAPLPQLLQFPPEEQVTLYAFFDAAFFKMSRMIHRFAM